MKHPTLLLAALTFTLSAPIPSFAAEERAQPASKPVRPPRNSAGRIPASSCQPAFRDNDLLYIGDSISVGAYGSALAKAASAGSADSITARFAIGGSAARQWAKSLSGHSHKNTACDTRAGSAFMKFQGKQIPTLPQLLGTARPRAIVIALGTNDLHNFCHGINSSDADSPRDMWLTGIQELADIAGRSGSKCVWVGPLTYQGGTIGNRCAQAIKAGRNGRRSGGMKGAIEELQKRVGSCQFIDSSTACPMSVSLPDGIHPSGKSATQLGTCIGNAVRAKLGR